MEYRYQLDPLPHQVEAVSKAYGRHAFAYLMDQGTGKTKCAYDEAFNLALLGSINLLVVVAPNDVHRAWIEEELPKHAIPEVPYVAAVWDNKRTRRKESEIAKLFDPGDHLRIFAVNVEAFQIGKPGQNRAFVLVRRLLRACRGMLVVDESQDIKTNKSQRTKTVIALGDYAPYRRILTGTPITQSPFDFYTQFKFLDPNILGFSTYGSFKNHYGTFIRRKSPHHKWNRWTGQKEDVYYDELISYKNIGELLEKVSEHCYRAEKRDCLKGLPSKVYMPPRRVAMSPAQKAMYKRLLETGVSQVRFEAYELQCLPRQCKSLEEELWQWCEGPDVPRVIADNALKVAGKLRQLCGGVVRDSEGNWHRTEDTPPKLRALLADIEHDGEPAIIWCIYREECALIADALRAQYGDEAVVVFNGAYDAEERALAKALFQDMNSPARFFVTTYAAARGHTLIKATASYYYSVHDSVEKRIQSEDRNHRVGAEGAVRDGQASVIYTDYVVVDTVDEKRYSQTMELVRSARQQTAALVRSIA